MNKGLYNADVQKIQQSVQQLSWIDQAEVNRVWPDAIDIKIVEQTPIVRWGGEKLLNKRGEIFVPENVSSFTDLPIIIGPEGSEKELLKIMTEMDMTLNEKEMGLVEFRVDERRAWKLKLQNNMELKLGRNEPLNKFSRF